MWVMRRALHSAPRRHRLSTKADAPAPSWAERNRNNLIHVSLSGAMFFMSIHLVNMKHQAEDMETELREQLHAATLARELMIRRAPELAREAGLPASSLAKFEAALQSLAAQPDGGAGASAALASAAAPPPPGAATSVGAAKAVW